MIGIIVLAFLAGVATALLIGAGLLLRTMWEWQKRW